MKKRLTRKQRKLFFVWGMLALPLLQWLIFFVYVNIDSILMAFQELDLNTGEVSWTFNNFKRFFYEWRALDSMKTAVKNSILAGLNDVVLILLSLLLSYFLYKKIPGRNAFRIIYFLPSVISMVIYTMVYKFMFDTSVGPINGLLGKLGVTDLPSWFGDTKLAFPLILIYCLWVGTGYNILIFSAAMESIPEDVIEYSKLEGVGRMRELFQIIIPMIWPTLAVAFLGSIKVIFTLFIQVELLTEGGPGGSTVTIAYLINSIIKGTNNNLEWGATMGLCFTLIATPIIILLKRFLDKTGERLGC